jgi:hypothetical protein
MPAAARGGRPYQPRAIAARRTGLLARAALAGALAAAALVPAPAGGHSLVRPAGEVVSYLSEDATSLNDLHVRIAGTSIEFVDRTVDGGMDPGACRSGEVTSDANLWIVQAFCPRAGVTALRVDLREREDTATIDVPFRATVLGGTGADRLTTTTGPDILDGGEGNDALAAGGGADRLTGGLGSDTVVCGPGPDRVEADQLAEGAADGEPVARVTTVPPPDAGDGGPDAVAPRVDVAAPRIQRLRGGRTVRVYATSTERGTIAASGFVDVRGLSLPLRTVRARVRVAGGGVELRGRFTAAQLREIRRALRRRGRVVVRLGVVATDLAGNSRRRDAPAIRVRA